MRAEGDSDIEPGFDAASVARCLHAIAESAALTQAFFERTLVTRLVVREGESEFVVVAEEGLAVRQLDHDGSWCLASADGVATASLRRAALRVARREPVLMPFPEALDRGPLPPHHGESLLAFARQLERDIRRHRVSFPFELELARHWRSSRTVGDRLAAQPQRSTFWSGRVSFQRGRCGFLLPEPPGEGGAAAMVAQAGAVAEAVVQRFLARAQPPPPPGERAIVLGPGAAAVLLHEAVGHVLEADHLDGAGWLAGAIGERLAPAQLDVLDDPGAAPPGVRRDADDEGSPCVQRWLLRRGVVAQPIADLAWVQGHERLVAGSGFTAHRTAAALPRCHHLVLLPGAAAAADLLRDCWYAADAVAGGFDPASDRCWLDLAHARRYDRGQPGARAGAFRVAGPLRDLLSRVVAVGDAPRAGGAGWCAKGGQRLPVWATAPSLRLDGVEVVG